MKDFYYQIKTREEDGHWSYKPCIKGIVEAETTAEARKIVKEQILCRDIKKGDDVLLYVCEVREGEEYLKDFFKPRVCKYCGRTYNQSISGWYSAEYCCENCCKLDHQGYLPKIVQQENYDIDNIDWFESNPVIYRIVNLSNNKCYIGQTIRAFTLRWWEHYKNWIKFQKEPLTDFVFEVLEEFSKQEIKENPKLLSEREQFWIEHYNSIENGYNARNEVASETAKTTT